MRWSADALECVHEASRVFLTRCIEDTNSAAIHSGKARLMQKDMVRIKKLRTRNGVFPGAYTGIENNQRNKPPDLNELDLLKASMLRYLGLIV